MKLFRHLTFLFLLLPLFCFSQKNSTEIDSLENVFICLDEESQTFHSYDDCLGLETCEGELKELSEATAMQKYHRAICCICWTNSEDNCKNDNPDGTENYKNERRYGGVV